MRTLYLILTRSSISGLLTARFLLHIQRWDSKYSTGDQTAITAQLNSADDSAELGRSTGASTFLSSIVEEFGSDPVAKAMDETTKNDVESNRVEENGNQVESG